METGDAMDGIDHRFAVPRQEVTGEINFDAVRRAATSLTAPTIGDPGMAVSIIYAALAGRRNQATSRPCALGSEG